MRVLVTGSSGRIGRAIVVRLAAEHAVVGLDRTPSSTTAIVAALDDTARLRRALDGADAVVHVAALHAPHVGLESDDAFERVNVQGTETLARLAVEAGVRTFVFTSTTALYGVAGAAGAPARWIDEKTTPQPRTVYHRTKLAAERRLAAIAERDDLAVTVLRMSRCFPEPAPAMALHRLSRGVDARDVADAHAAALDERRAAARERYRTFVISGATPFLPEDVAELGSDATRTLARRAPELVDAFARRGWTLPATIDRVYSPARAASELGWRSVHGFAEVLAELDRRSSEVLPPGFPHSRPFP